jgi:hypothetical protein
LKLAEIVCGLDIFPAAVYLLSDNCTKVLQGAKKQEWQEGIMSSGRYTLYRNTHLKAVAIFSIFLMLVLAAGVVLIRDEATAFGSYAAQSPITQNSTHWAS